MVCRRPCVHRSLNEVSETTTYYNLHNHIQQKPVKRLQLMYYPNRIWLNLGMIRLIISFCQKSTCQGRKNSSQSPRRQSTRVGGDGLWGWTRGEIRLQLAGMDEDWFLSKNIRRFISNFHANIFGKHSLLIVMLKCLTCVSEVTPNLTSSPLWGRSQSPKGKGKAARGCLVEWEDIDPFDLGISGVQWVQWLVDKH